MQFYSRLLRSCGSPFLPRQGRPTHLPVRRNGIRLQNSSQNSMKPTGRNRAYSFKQLRTELMFQTPAPFHSSTLPRPLEPHQEKVGLRQWMDQLPSLLSSSIIYPHEGLAIYSNKKYSAQQSLCSSISDTRQSSAVQTTFTWEEDLEWNFFRSW